LCPTTSSSASSAATASRRAASAARCCACAGVSVAGLQPVRHTTLVRARQVHGRSRSSGSRTSGRIARASTGTTVGAPPWASVAVRTARESGLDSTRQRAASSVSSALGAAPSTRPAASYCSDQAPNSAAVIRAFAVCADGRWRASQIRWAPLAPSSGVR